MLDAKRYLQGGYERRKQKEKAVPVLDLTALQAKQKLNRSKSAPKHHSRHHKGKKLVEDNESEAEKLYAEMGEASARLQEKLEEISKNDVLNTLGKSESDGAVLGLGGRSANQSEENHYNEFYEREETHSEQVIDNLESAMDWLDST